MNDIMRMTLTTLWTTRPFWGFRRQLTEEFRRSVQVCRYWSKLWEQEASDPFSEKTFKIIVTSWETYMSCCCVNFVNKCFYRMVWTVGVFCGILIIWKRIIVHASKKCRPIDSGNYLEATAPKTPHKRPFPRQGQSWYRTALLKIGSL